MPRILVVDDEAGLREFACDALATEGYEVHQAASAEAALVELRRRAFDLVLTDLRMPGMSGLELLVQVKRELPETEVVVLTAYGSVENAVEAMRLGAYDYLTKPLEGPGELRLVAARALERRTLLDLRQHQARESSELPPLAYGGAAMAEVVRSLRKVAATGATVLLEGESGTGKELAARTLHAWSRRAAGPFVALNCAALTDTLVESELFGHEKGAFTGATETRRGRLELAAGGTFFLDEIGELKTSLQAKLLRVLQEGEFERVGGQRTLASDVRWVAATNRNLEARVAEGAFREDLFHRLAVFPLRLPPLRERRDEIAPLADRLLAEIAAGLGRAGLRLSHEARRRLEAADWPGNIRELRNTLERAAILAEGEEIRVADLLLRSTPGPADAPPVRSLAEAERQSIEAALAATGGNRTRAAELLGIGVRTLFDKLKRYQEG